MTLLEWLVAKFPEAKRQTLRRMLQSQRITVNGRVAKSLKQAIRPADKVRIEPVGRNGRRAIAPRGLPFEIVHEDDDILIINKPPGLLTSTVPREKRATALAAVREYLAESHPTARVGLIHRLDRDASGLLVFSKNPNAFRSLKQQFFRHSVDRVYHVLVEGVPNPRAGRIESRLVEYADGSVHSTRRGDSGQVAVTNYEMIQTRNGQSLLRVTLHTGRKHQIRAQLAERGAPVVNDPVYSKRKPAGRLMLAAVELGFDHPRTNRRVKFSLKPPFGSK
jgi:23S rRNA pseudouridine1911/1915/1917 synthase